MRLFSFLFVCSIVLLQSCANKAPVHLENAANSTFVAEHNSSEIIPGAERIAKYFPLIKGKKVGLVGNQSSLVGDVHLVDTLLELGVQIEAIFVPEHGFRGQADAGEVVKNSVLEEIPIISIYGKNKKPKEKDLENIDIIVFDLQDVGVRFYTYCSTLHYVMQACSEQEIPLIVLDRPNPNAHYIDGPVLDMDFSSFVGLHPVPVVYGMTIGEYAQMINGERWHHPEKDCELYIVPCKNYDHSLFYDLRVPPSPNLPNARAIALYPSLCFFEGTPVSIGRGTETPFQIIGHPAITNSNFTFTPVSGPGAKNPKHQDEACYGMDLTNRSAYYYREKGQLDLSYLMQFYQELNLGESFFLENLFFDKLAGSDQLRKQILSGLTEDEIRNSWQEDLRKFKELRSKYLIY